MYVVLIVILTYVKYNTYLLTYNTRDASILIHVHEIILTVLDLANVQIFRFKNFVKLYTKIIKLPELTKGIILSSTNLKNAI